MSNKNLAFYFLYFTGYILFQVLVLKGLVLFDAAFCFVYIAFVLYLPLQINHSLLIFLGFATGIIVDTFHDSLGVHAAATTLLAFLRPYYLHMVTPGGGYEDVNTPRMAELGFNWTIIYLLPLIFVHHAALFYIEAGGFQHFFYTSGKVVSSTIFTLMMVVIFQAFRRPSSRRYR